MGSMAILSQERKKTTGKGRRSMNLGLWVKQKSRGKFWVLPGA